MGAYTTDADWPRLGIVCPFCGNRGLDDAAWLLNGDVPFRLVEDVARSWTFSAARISGDGLVMIADANRDDVDWENGLNRRLECMQCLAQFPLPADVIVNFE